MKVRTVGIEWNLRRLMAERKNADDSAM